MYNFIVTKRFLDNQNSYIKSLNSKEILNFKSLKELFIKDIFDSKLKTHKIYENNGVVVYSSYINKKDRIIFFFKDPNNIYLYKIMTDHDYTKLLSNVNSIMNKFLSDF